MSQPRNRPKLKIIGTPEQVSAYVADETVPATRADCVGRESTCGHYGCRYNLTSTAPIDRQGRRHSDHQHRSWKVDLRRPSRCALEVIDRNPSGLMPSQIAELLQCTPRRIEQILAIAQSKIDLQARTDHELADQIDRPREPDSEACNVSLPADEQANMPRVQTPANASIHLTVMIGERSASVDLTSDASRHLLRLMAESTAQALRDARRQVRQLLEVAT